MTQTQNTLTSRLASVAPYWRWRIDEDEEELTCYRGRRKNRKEELLAAAPDTFSPPPRKNSHVWDRCVRHAVEMPLPKNPREIAGEESIRAVDRFEDFQFGGLKGLSYRAGCEMEAGNTARALLAQGLWLAAIVPYGLPVYLCAAPLAGAAVACAAFSGRPNAISKLLGPSNNQLFEARLFYALLVESQDLVSLTRHLDDDSLAVLVQQKREDLERMEEVLKKKPFVVRHSRRLHIAIADHEEHIQDLESKLKRRLQRKVISERVASGK